MKVESVEPIFSQYFQERKILLVEPSASALNNLIFQLTNLGAKKEKIFATSKIDEAIQVIALHQPSLLISEFQMGKKVGLNLLERLDQIVGESQRIAIFMTRENDDASIAEAAEDQIDAYILKPYSMNHLQEKLLECIQRKTKPSRYFKHIRSGREYLLQKDFNLAIQEFEDAKLASSKPALAFYFSGLTYGQLQHFENAENEFKAGLKLIPLHYRCLTGEFDILFEQKKYSECYKLVDDIRRHYPLSVTRLGNIFLAGSYCNRFEDFTDLFQIYRHLSHRPPELIKIVVASMKLAGRVTLKAKRADKAFEFFQMGAEAALLGVDYLNEAIRDLLGADEYLYAIELYRQFPIRFQGTDLHQILGFLVRRSTEPPDQVFELGKKTLTKIIRGDPDFYRELVGLAVELGRQVYAEDIIAKAVSEFPEMRGELYQMMGDQPLEK